MTAMNNLMEGLKTREEMLADLRFLFLNEEMLLKEGWYSESEFFDAVIQTVEETVEKLKEEWQFTEAP